MKAGFGLGTVDFFRCIGPPFSLDSVLATLDRVRYRLAGERDIWPLLAFNLFDDSFSLSTFVSFSFSVVCSLSS